jgi:hypothetical protein
VLVLQPSFSIGNRAFFHNSPLIFGAWVAKISSAVVWDVLTDTAKWPEWGPSLRTVGCTAHYTYASTSGRVRTAVGICLSFAAAEHERLA